MSYYCLTVYNIFDKMVKIIHFIYNLFLQLISASNSTECNWCIKPL